MSVQNVGLSVTVKAWKNVEAGVAKQVRNAPLKHLEAVTQAVSDLALDAVRNDYLERVKHMGDTVPAGPTCGCNPADSSHPAGSLKVDDKTGAITTPGGYKIEATKQHEWKITTPEGKETRIWGDPHVAEKDGGRWDFKKDSTFMLPDGTRINCSTTPWGNKGMTVTKGLEIISGNERVQVSDIDKGKGKTGAVTQDGFAHVNSFGNKDVFVMAGDGDDWTLNGKEIVGSNNGGDSFKLGKEMPALVKNVAAKPTEFGGPEQWIQKMVDQLKTVFENMGSNTAGNASNTYANGHGCWGTPANYNPQQHLSQLTDSFRNVGNMFRVLNALTELSASLNTLRTIHG